GEIMHVLGREVGRHRAHARIAAASGLEIPELKIEVTRRLPGENRIVRAGRISHRPVARNTDYRLRFARIGVGMNGSRKRPDTHARTQCKRMPLSGSKTLPWTPHPRGLRQREHKHAVAALKV